MEQLNFKDLAISETILKALDDLGFQQATPIQAQSIPFILEGRDVIGLAQTGTGKTLAFGVPLIQKIDKTSDKVQVIVLSPTRELAMQITNELRKYCSYEEGVRMLTVYGGESIDKQILALKKRPQIVVGTPGRIMDHMRRKTLRLETITMVVLDEADEMLNMGFQEDIDTILQDVPDTKQMVLFSATFPQDLMKIAKTYQNDPITINVRNQDVTVKNIKQCVIETSESNKFEVVSRVIDAHDFRLTLIFCNTKKRVDELAEYLHIHGYRVKALHGDLKQKERDFVMNLFRKSQLDILIATDVAARGIDVDEIDAVINFDVPQDEQYYVHRIGRTGRAGREGVSYILATSRQKGKLRFIERLTKTPLIPTQVPTMKQIEAKRMEALLNEIKLSQETINDKVATFLPKLLEVSELDYEALTKTLFSMMITERFKNVSELKVVDKAERFDRRESAIEDGFKRVFLNIGNDHRVSPGTIIRTLAGESGISGNNFGAIEISSYYSYVELPEEFYAQLMSINKQAEYNTKTLELSDKAEEAWASQTTGRKERSSRDRSDFGSDRSRSRGDSQGRKPAFGGERSRPSSFGGERKPSFGGERKPAFGGGERKPAFGGGERKPSFGGDRKPRGDGERSRPSSFGERSHAHGDGEKKSFGAAKRIFDKSDKDAPIRRKKDSE